MSLHRAALAIVALAAGACIELSTAPRVGDMEISVHITGADPDTDQLVLIIDSTVKRTLSVAYANVAIHDVTSGMHTVELAEVALNCTVADAPMRRVTVEYHETTTITFDVTCIPTGLAVTTRTTGADTMRAYKVLIRDSIVARPAANDSVIVTHIKPGTFTVSLAVPVDNCAVASSNSVTTRVLAHRLVALHFDVACGPRVRVPKIAFVNDTTVDGRSGTWIAQMNVDGSYAERLEPGHSPTWSPDGTKLAFSQAHCGYDFYDYFYDCTGGLAIVDVERWAVAQPPISYTVLDPAWSPRDDRIAFVSCCNAAVNHLYVTRLDGSAAADPVSSQLGYSHPSWSPDGERIAFSCLMLNKGTTWDLCIVPAGGSQLTVLPRRSDDQASRALPAWSPDGSQIAFSKAIGQLAIYTLATNEVTPLTEGTEPAWSPDGRLIVFTRQDGLFVINAEGSNLHRITRGRHSQPAWRP